MELLENIEIISEVIEFESGLRILLSLNTQFTFENESCFSTTELEQNKKKQHIIPKSPQMVKKEPLFTDQKAIEYLLKNVFNH